MRAIFHTFMIWLMLLAIPVQGFAATSMALCERTVTTAQLDTSNGAVAHAAPQMHDHAAILAHHDHAYRASTSHHHDGGLHHNDAKCGACAACCLGATMSGSFRVQVATMPAAAERFFPVTSFPRSVVPAHPERPPQASLV